MHPFRRHRWQAVAVTHRPSRTPPLTHVLYRCTRPRCPAAATRDLEGLWSVDDVAAAPTSPAPALRAVPAPPKEQ